MLQTGVQWPTDGKYFYYNPNFVKFQFSDPRDYFLVGHEVLHCVYDLWMQKDVVIEYPLWNIANDYVINADSIDANIGEEIKLVEICHDWKYRGKISEEIYDDLFEQAKEDGKIILEMDTLDVPI